MAPRQMERVIDTLNRPYEVVLGATKQNNERAYRISTLIVDEALRTQDERIDLAKRWADRPGDVYGFSNAVIETWARRGRRRLELMRTGLDVLGEMGIETRTAVQESAAATGKAVAQTARAGRNAAGRAAEQVGEAAVEAGEAVRRGADGKMD